MAAILASVDDVNANLPNELAVTDESEIDLIQLSVARVVRGYLSRVLDNTVLMSWDDPASTPELIREAAAKMIAAQYYANRIASQVDPVIADESFPQRRYNEAMAILERILSGDEELPGIDVVATDQLTDLDYFPIDDTDRAFTMGMLL
jgi:hypothetical protein